MGKWARWGPTDSPLDYMKVVDHINLLGVKLARTTNRTRELTGADLVSSVQSKINHFKAGRHSALVLKPHLANVYLLSKISHKAAAVHLKSTDVQKLQHAIKSWVSQELLRKPKELLLYRSKEDGGLGLVNVKARAMANLTRTFLQSVLSSTYSSAIYKAFVKDDEDAKQIVKKPSFYPEAMFASVKEALRDLGGQIFSLTAKQWQTRLTENLATHVRDPTSGIVSLLPSPAEESWPDSNWSQSRLNLSLRGLSPNQKSTLFKLSNDLLPHSEQLQKFKLATTAECQFCKESDGALHFFTCVQAQNLGSFLQDSLSPAFFTEEQFSWTKVKTLDLSTPSLQDRLSGLVLTAEVVNHILASRKNSQAASPTKLAAILRCSGEVVAKSFPNAGTSLTTWADRLRALSQPQDLPGSSPARSQAGDRRSWGHPMPHFNLAL